MIANLLKIIMNESHSNLSCKRAIFVEKRQFLKTLSMIRLGGFKVEKIDLRFTCMSKDIDVRQFLLFIFINGDLYYTPLSIRSVTRPNTNVLLCFRLKSLVMKFALLRNLVPKEYM